MSARTLWTISILFALLGWAAVLALTAMVPPSWEASVALMPLLAVAVTMTLAPLVWLAGRWLRLPGVGQRPALALRSAAWIGLWTGICVLLQFNRLFSWLLGATLAVVMALFEGYLRQTGHQKRR